MEELKNKIRLVTHDGRFHADDVFATASILIMLGDGVEYEIFRTRDIEIIKTGDYIYDVGGIYDKENNCFDHHQEGGAGERKSGIPYSSFGLIWEKYGEKICDSKNVADTLDIELIESIDAMDNNIDIYRNIYPDLYPQTFNDIVFAFYPTWLEDDSDHFFLQAVDFAKILLKREIKKATDKEKAKPIIDEIYKKTEDKRIIILDKNYPYHSFIKKYKEPLFMVRPSEVGSNWMVESIKKNVHSFDYRKLLPKKWAGKVDKELSKITGVEGSIFSHKNRFLIVSETKEGAIKLANIANKYKWFKK